MRGIVVGRRGSRLSSYQLPGGRVGSKGAVGEEYLQRGRLWHVVCEIARINNEGWALILLEQFDYAN
jgi:hypothetical protein